MMQEIWKDIKGYEGFYQISNFGRVASLTRIVKVGEKRQKIQLGRILSQQISGNGYYYLSLCKNGINKTERPHRLVGLYFLKKIEGKNQINHKDGNKLNNISTNLEWCSASENMKHAYKNNLEKKIVGEKCNFAKLTEIKVKEILTLINSKKIMLKDIARIYGVCRSTISSIKNKKNWRYLYD